MYAVDRNRNIDMNEMVNLEDVNIRFYSALSEFERLICKGFLNLEESNRKWKLEKIMSSCMSEIRRYQAGLRRQIAELESSK